MNIILPERATLCIPPVTLLSGVPEYYSDGWTVEQSEEVQRMIFFVRTRQMLESNLTVVLRRSGFDKSLLTTAALFLPTSAR